MADAAANPFDQFDSGPSAGATAAPAIAANPFDQFDKVATNDNAPSGTTIPYGAASVASGFNRGVAQTIGAPVDLATWAMKKAGIYPSGENAPAPFLGSEWIEKHALPTPLPIHNELESALQGAGAGAASAIIPVGGAASLGERALAAAAPYVGEATGAGLATNAGVGAVSGAGGQLAADVAPDKYKPLAGVAGGILAPTVALGAPLLAAQGVRAVAAGLPAITEAGQIAAARRQVGQELTTSATNAPAAMAALETAPREIIPGSQGTLGPMAGDTGLIAYEKAVAESPEGKAAYADRLAQQNAARQNAIAAVQPQGNIGELPVAIRANAAAVDTATQQALVAAQAKAAANEQLVGDVTQSHVEGAQQAQQSALANIQALKPDASPLETAMQFRAMRDAVEQESAKNVNAAQGAAAQARSMSAPIAQNPEQVGGALRAPVQAANVSAQDATTALYNALPKDMVAPTADIAAKANAIQSAQLPEHSPISGEEARLYGLAQDYGDTMPLANVNALRGSILTARSTLRQSDPQAFGRLGQLQGVVEGAVDHAVENRAALDQIAARRGVISPQSTVQGKLEKVRNVLNAPSESTAAVAPRQSGIGPGPGRSESGNVSGAPSVGSENGRLGMPSGNQSIPAGTGANAPGIAGVGARSIAVDNSHDIPYLAGSSNDGKTVYIDRRVPATMTVGDKTFDPRKYLMVHELRENHEMTINGQPYETAHRAALNVEKAAVEGDGINWNGYQEQMQKMAAQTQRESPTNPPSDLYTKPYPHNEAEFLKHEAEAHVGAPTPLAAEGEATAAPLRQANAAYREMKQTFGEGAVGDVLAKTGRGEPKLSNAEVAGQFLHGRQTEGEDVRGYLKAAGPQGIPAMSDAAAYSLHEAATRPDGTFDAAKAAKWIDDHKLALNELPADVRSKFENAANAQQAVGDALAKQRDTMSNFNKSEAGTIAGLGHEGDIVKHVGSIIDSKTAPEQRLAQLADAAKTNPSAQDGLKRAVIEHVLNKFVPEGAEPKTDALQTYLGIKGPILSKVLSPDELRVVSDRVAAASAAKVGVEAAQTGRAEGLKGVQQAGKEAVGAAAQARAEALSKYDRGVLGQLKGVNAEGDILNTMRGVLNAKDGAAKMQMIASEAAKVPGASDALKKAVTEVIKRDFSSTTEAGVSGQMELRRAGLKSFMDTKTDALKAAGLSDQQIGLLRAVTEDGLQANRTVSAIKSKGGSDTLANQAMAAKLAQSGKGSMMSHIAVDAALAGAGHVVGGLPGLVIGKYIGDKVMGAMRESGMNRVRQLRSEAVLNPDLGLALMKELPRQPNRDTAALLGLRLRQMSTAGMLANQQH